MLPGILERAHPRDVLRDIPAYPPRSAKLRITFSTAQVMSPYRLHRILPNIHHRFDALVQQDPLDVYIFAWV